MPWVRPCSRPTCRTRRGCLSSVDIDDDGYWAVAELPQLLTRPADVEVHIDFAAAAEPLTVRVDPESRLAVDTRPSESTLARIVLPIGELMVQVLDGAAAGLAETDWDRLWQQWDHDQDESLDAEEYQTAEPLLGVPLRIADADGDGQLQHLEGVNLLRRRRRGQETRLQIQLRPESLPVWTRLDSDRDHRLTERELRGAADQLAR